MNFFKKIFSYIIEMPVEKTSSPINPALQVFVKKGEYILDANDANYSYDTLQSNFEKEFSSLKIKEREFNSLLLLGFGAGSIISSLQEKYGKKFRTVAVEKDPAVIDLGNKHFDINRFSDLEIIIDDAASFMNKNEQTFDLIIIDVYIGKDVPDSCETEAFLLNLKNSLNNTGLIIFNKYIYNEATNLSAQQLAERFKNIFGKINTSKVNKTMFSFDASIKQG